MQVTDEVSLGGWSRVRSYPAAMMMRWSERRQDLDLDGRFTAMLRLFRRRVRFQMSARISIGRSVQSDVLIEKDGAAGD
jgi:hypothetical protein